MDEHSLRQLWNDRSDDDLRLALRELFQYEPEAQEIIREEAAGRGDIDIEAEILRGDPIRNMTDDTLMATIREPDSDPQARQLLHEEARRRSTWKITGVTRSELLAVGMKLLGIYFVVFGGTDLITVMITYFPYAGSKTPDAYLGGQMSLPVVLSRAMLKPLCFAAAGVWLIVTGNKELERIGRPDINPDELDD